MEEGNRQKELFELEKPKRSFPSLSNIFPRPDFEGKIAITLTLEKLVLVIIGIIMIAVIVYAAGIENGRSLGRMPISVAMTPQKAAPRQPAEAVEPKTAAISIALIRPAGIAEKSGIPESATVKIKTVPIEKVPVMAAADNGAKRPYTIIAAAFSNKDAARAETARLRASGFDAAIVQSGRYFTVCVGSYTNKTSAQTILKKLRQRYRDAYIKLK